MLSVGQGADTSAAPSSTTNAIASNRTDWRRRSDDQLKVARLDTISNATSTNLVDVGVWTIGQRTLLLATNMADSSASVNVNLPVRSSSATEVLNSGGSVSVNGDTATVALDGLASVGFVLE